jgi:streptogramin lyase
MARSRFATPLFATVLVVLVAAACSSDVGSDASVRPPIDSTVTTDLGPVDQTPPSGANGIKIDEDGDLWVAVLIDNEILRVDGESGEILQRLAVPALSGPDDLVIGEDGTIWWTGFTSGEVGALDPTTGRNTELVNVGEGANPIAQRGDGMLVVGRAVTATGLFAVDPAGDTEPEELADPGNVNSFSIAPDGTLYAPLADLDGNAAVAIDPFTGEIADTIAPIEGIPIALRWRDDELFVLTLNPAGVVYRVDPADGSVELFADTGLTTADNLAVADDGEVFVTGFDQPLIAVFDADGAPVRTITIGG